MVAHLARLPDRADRLHPRAGQGLPGRQRAAARRRQPRAHRGGDGARRRDRARHARRRAHDPHPRLLDPHQQQHLERRRHVRHPRSRSRSGCAHGAARRRDRRPNLREQFRQIQEAQSSSPSARRRSTASATPAASSSRCRTAATPGSEALQGAVENVIRAGNAQPGLVGLFSSFRATQPQLYVDVDRAKAKALGVLARRRLPDAPGLPRLGLRQRLHPLRPQLAGERAGRRAPTASTPRTSASSRSATATGEMVPLATLVTVRDTTGPAIVNRYNMFPSAEINGGTAPGVSSGQAIAIMESARGAGAARRRWASSGRS